MSERDITRVRAEKQKNRWIEKEGEKLSESEEKMIGIDRNPYV